MLGKHVVASAIVVALAVPGVAAATPASSSLTGANGEGSYNPTLPCGIGDGPNWRYAWHDQPAVSPGGVLSGEWDGTFEVHDAGIGAFIPDGTGRLSLTVAREGTGYFETRGNGSCTNASLTLAGVDDGEPVVSGSLPVVATGGFGALKDLTGSGNASFELQLGPGADNAAAISLSGDFDVADPQLSVPSASSRWLNLSNYLGKRLGVGVTVSNALAGGHAFDVRVASVSGGTGSFAGVPTSAGTITPASARGYGFEMLGAKPGQTYTITVTVTAKDGLLAPNPPLVRTVSFKAPPLP